MRSTNIPAVPQKKATLSRDETPSKKISRHKTFLRGLLWFGIACILLIPSYIAISDYVIHRNAPASETEILYVSASLTGPSGQTTVSRPSEESDQAGLLEILGSLISGGQRISTIPPDFQVTYRLYIETNTGIGSYRMYCNAASTDLYFADANGNCFRADTQDAGIFLNSSFAYELYPQSAIPVLTTAATDEIIPSEISWSYQTQNRNFTDRIAIETTDEILTYPIANDIGFTFSLEPSNYTVTITQNGTPATYTNQNTFSMPQLSEDELLDVVITATYAQGVSEYYGSVTYRFQMNVVEAAQFSPNRTELNAGGYLILTCKNVKNAQKLQISVTPALAGDPVIFTIADTVYAAIPVGEAANKKLSVTYGTISDSFDLKILPNEQARSVAKSGEELRGNWTSLLQNGLAELLAAKGATTATDMVTPAGLFADYTRTDAERLLGFGDRLSISGGAATEIPFELYRMSGSVTTLSFGVVKETGNDDLLGKYIIVDHGCGLCTWYCGLSEIRVNEGKIVATGEEIGVAGKTGAGYADETDVLILATIGKVAVSPEELRKNPYLP